MDSFSRMIGISIFYIISCKYIGPALMKNREPFSLKTTIIIYNILQMIVCSITAYAVSALVKFSS